MLNAAYGVRMQLKVVREGVLDGDHKFVIVGDYENFFEWLERGFRNFDLPIVLRHYARTISPYYLLFFVSPMLFEILETVDRLLCRYKDDLLEVWRSALRREKFLAFSTFLCRWVFYDFIDVVENDTEIALRVQLVLCVDAFTSERRLKFDHILHLQKLTSGLWMLAIACSLCLRIKNASV